VTRTLDQIRAEPRAMLPERRRRRPVAALGIFGSWARGERRAESDLDLPVGLGGPTDLFSLLELDEEIGHRLHREVEQVTRPARRPIPRESAPGDLVPA
jgi:hypothetical protein